eukprot:g5684.t1
MYFTSNVSPNVQRWIDYAIEDMKKTVDRYCHAHDESSTGDDDDIVATGDGSHGGVGVTTTAKLGDSKDDESFHSSSSDYSESEEQYRQAELLSPYCDRVKGKENSDTGEQWDEPLDVFDDDLMYSDDEEDGLFAGGGPPHYARRTSEEDASPHRYGMFASSSPKVTRDDEDGGSGSGESSK